MLCHSRFGGCQDSSSLQTCHGKQPTGSFGRAPATQSPIPYARIWPTAGVAGRGGQQPIKVRSTHSPGATKATRQTRCSRQALATKRRPPARWRRTSCATADKKPHNGGGMPRIGAMWLYPPIWLLPARVRQRAASLDSFLRYSLLSIMNTQINRGACHAPNDDDGSSK